MSSASTVTIIESAQAPQALASSLWPGNQEIPYEKASGLSRLPRILKHPLFPVSTTPISDPWLIDQWLRDAVVTIPTTSSRLLIRDLGWTREQAIETRLRLQAFEQDWDAPGMEIYDEL